MFLLISILAASIDGFISGFVISGMGVNFGLKDFFKAFTVIFFCCLIASFTGHSLAVIRTDKYINILGAIIMILLSAGAVSPSDKHKDFLNIYTVSFSVAADASVLCIYLAMEGYGFISVSALSAAMHSILMFSGVKISEKIIVGKWQKAARYFSATVFFLMALYKISEI